FPNWMTNAMPNWLQKQKHKKRNIFGNLLFGDSQFFCDFSSCMAATKQNSPDKINIKIRKLESSLS
ncbi:hypothetical protein, partial [Anaerotignum lactatifermentans]|uniref:hypothetical protein n=1 Tax=Anaerotignum lactatifermentans TaxID=160404 RepID=UPI00242D7D06